VLPATQRLIVLVDTSSRRAAASIVRPSARSRPASQAAKDGGKGSAGARAGSSRGGAMRAPRSIAGGAARSWPPPRSWPWSSGEKRTSTSAAAGKIRNDTWMVPLTPAASSNTSATRSHRLRTPSSEIGVEVN
jgi:hypothetical protein